MKLRVRSIALQTHSRYELRFFSKFKFSALFLLMQIIGNIRFIFCWVWLGLAWLQYFANKMQRSTWFYLKDENQNDFWNNLTNRRIEIMICIFLEAINSCAMCRQRYRPMKYLRYCSITYHKIYYNVVGIGSLIVSMVIVDANAFFWMKVSSICTFSLWLIASHRLFGIDII